MQLSAHFSLQELTHSEIAIRKGIDNKPNAEVRATLAHTASMLEQVRDVLLGSPMHISSGYRSPAVNSAVGGAPTSQHVKGEAVDFTAPIFGTPQDVCRAIADSDVPFDQLIYEGAWCHVSFSVVPRHSVLTAHFEGGRVRYTAGIA